MIITKEHKGIVIHHVIEHSIANRVSLEVDLKVLVSFNNLDRQSRYVDASIGLARDKEFIAAVFGELNKIIVSFYEYSNSLLISSQIIMIFGNATFFSKYVASTCFY